MSSSSNQQQQPQQPQQPQPPPPAPTVAGVTEYINQEGAAQLVALTWNQIQHGAEWVGNTACITYQMLSNAYVRTFYDSIVPINAEESKDRAVFMNEAFDVGGRLDREQPLGSS